MAKRLAISSFLILALLVAGAGTAFAAAQSESAKTDVTFFWALYDGLTEEYRADLQDAFNAAQDDIEVEIVPIQWGQMHDRLTTSLAGGQPPEISVIGTRWLLEFMALDAVEEVTRYVSAETIDNIAAGAMEALVGGRLMGLPIAAGARILAYNPNRTSVVPQTMEELRAEARRITADTDAYGLIMPGKKSTELTDFAYYLLAAGGNFFETLADGSYGRSTVNSPAGVKALEFMVTLANEDQVVQEGFLALDRTESHPIFYAGNAGYVFIGAWVESAMNQAGVRFSGAVRADTGVRGPAVDSAHHHRLGGDVQRHQSRSGRRVPRLLLSGRVEGGRSTSWSAFRRSPSAQAGCRSSSRRCTRRSAKRPKMPRAGRSWTGSPSTPTSYGTRCRRRTSNR